MTDQGLDLDPVYTGKVMATLRTMNAEDRHGPDPILFLDPNDPR